MNVYMQLAQYAVAHPDARACNINDFFYELIGQENQFSLRSIRKYGSSDKEFVTLFVACIDHALRDKNDDEIRAAIAVLPPLPFYEQPLLKRAEEVELKTDQQLEFERGRDIEYALNPPIDDE